MIAAAIISGVQEIGRRLGELEIRSTTRTNLDHTRGPDL